MKQEGPKEIVIPEQRFMSCHGCDFHTNRLFQSGRNPVYHDNCNHPDFPRKPRALSGNLHKNIDGHLQTPIDCPFRKKEQRDSAGSYGHGSSGQFMRTQIDYDGRR